jgi:ADP-ribosylglycohydrolase
VGYYSAIPLLEKKRKIDHDLAIEGLLLWNSIPIYAQCAGPTTRVAIAKLKGEETQEAPTRLCVNSRVTNGGGMKAGMMGLFNPGDIDGAIEDALTLCMLTHNNTIALSASCAIAAATAKAFDSDASYIDLIQAGMAGAQRGYDRAKNLGAGPVAGCSIVKRIALAAEIGIEHQGDFEAAMRRIADIIGCGLYAYESIPAVFGFIAACKAHAQQTIHMAVNAGDDTDTVACMAGYIVGALAGVGGYPAQYLDLINTANGFDLGKMAGDIDALV